jgi:predicted NBD/HSP70 family sugar kinase
MLSTDPATLLVAGAFFHLGENRLELQIGNLLGETLAHSEHMLGDAARPADIADVIADNLPRLTRNADGSRLRPAALGISLAGMVDAERGILHWLPPAPPSPYPLAEILEERTGLPVFVDNVCNVVARAERWFGPVEFSDDLCVVFVGAGIGLAQYVGGSLHRGSHGLNSEFGHVKTGIGAAKQCGCGSRGCLVQSAGFVALAVQANAAFGWSIDPLTDYDVAFGRIAALAADGNAAATALFSEAAEALGIAIANHIAIWDPSRILVITLHPDWPEAIGAPMIERIAENVLPPARHGTAIDIRVENLGLAKMGTTALALDEMIHKEDLSRWIADRAPAAAQLFVGPRKNA